MMECLSKDKVLHVANLARLSIDDNEIEKYGKQLCDILTEIDKIIEVDIDAKEAILIAPTDSNNRYSEDEIGDMLTKEEVLKNAKHKAGDFIAVPRVIND